MKTAVAIHFLEFHHPFRLSGVSRTGTDSVFIRVEYQGNTGFGEATLPPYLSENKEVVLSQVRKFSRQAREQALGPKDCFPLLPDPYEYPASRCALEEALLSCQTGYPEVSLSAPPCSFTIGIGTEEEDIKKIEESSGFSILKIKLGRPDDAERIRRIRRLTDKSLCVDLNQGYTSREEAKRIACILGDLGVIFMEQPFAKNDYDSHLWLKKNSPVPVIADESIRNMDDLVNYGTFFDGINVKLLKAGGPVSALEMLTKAKKEGLYSVIGCMSESGCGIYHASHLQYLANLADLDGPWLIKNDPFKCIELVNGKITANKLAMTGKLDFKEL